MEAIKRARTAKERRDQFRHSEEGVKATIKSAENVFEQLLELADQYKDDKSGYVFSNERSNSGRLKRQLSIYAVGFTLRLNLQIPSTNSIEGLDDFGNACIRVRFFDGVVRRGYRSRKQPKVQYEFVYQYDIDGFGGEGWRRLDGSNKLLPPEEVAVAILTRFIKFAEENRMW